MTMARQVATVTVATVGLGLNLKAWMLLGPRLAQRTDVGLREYVLLMGVPLAVAAVARIPAGVLTDRYGARAVFPAVSLVAAGSVVWLDFAGTVPAIVLAGGAAGIGGTAFVAGAAQVSRNVGYGRRGLALGVFGTAPAVAVLISAVSWVLDPDGRRAAVVLGAVLIGFAVLAAVVLPAQTGTTRAGPLVPRCLERVRLAAATALRVLCGPAPGGS